MKTFQLTFFLTVFVIAIAYLTGCGKSGGKNLMTVLDEAQEARQAAESKAEKDARRQAEQTLKNLREKSDKAERSR